MTANRTVAVALTGILVLLGCTRAEPEGPDASDRAAIVAAAAFARIRKDNSFGGTTRFDRIAIVGNYQSADPNGFLIASPDDLPIEESARSAVEQELAPSSIVWVGSVLDATGPDPNVVPPPYDAVLSLSAPEIDGEKVTVTSNLWCGGTCGIGGAHLLERTPAGVWIVVGPDGPQWVA